jgi:hypothetical protein
MKKILILAFLVLMASSAFAATRNFKVTWIANTDDTAMYRLYLNNAAIADIAGIATVSWTGACTVIEGSNKFELTALDAMNNESARSNPCFFVFDSTAPGIPKGLNLLLLP